MEETWTLALICTDRGGHDPVVLQEVMGHGPLADLVPSAFLPSLSGSALELTCQCGRNPRWRHADLVKIAAVAYEAMRAGQRRVEVDLSKLNR